MRKHEEEALTQRIVLVSIVGITGFILGACWCFWIVSRA